MIKQLIVVSSFLLASIANIVVEVDGPGGTFAKADQRKIAVADAALPCPLLSNWFHCRPM